ncbi:MAG TPA: hypothetical protein VNL15_07765, partial [Dehalococcoidia bacterium]|nr:hypothetical protein [Dehalococcoidia bacterium]
DGLREQVSARLSSPEEVLERAPGEVIFCGEVKPEFAERIEEKLPGARISPDPVWFGRAVHLARLGSQRLREQGGQPPSLLRPLYLRDPAIGPQTERK